jgi:ABC-2 type transport system permease protein
VVQGVAVLAWAVGRLDAWDLRSLLVIGGALLGGSALFLGMQVVQACACFWIQDGLEVFNVLTYGGETLGAYPLPIFQRWLQHLLIGVIPVAAISYLPALVVTHRCAPGWPSLLAACAPALGVVFVAASLLLWRVALRRFAATG